MAVKVLNHALEDGKREYLLDQLTSFIEVSVPAPRKKRERNELVPIYFASGSNHAGEIKGFAGSGMNLGIAAPEVYKQTKTQKAAQQALRDLKGTGTLVFVDSGAFEEVGFKGGRPYDKKPISDAEWKKRLNFYLDMAQALGDQVYLVAPDKIADQKATFSRLRKYMPLLDPVMRKRGKNRPNIIVPIQKGGLSMIEFDRKIRRILGDANFVRGIPMKKDATSLPELIAFVKELYRDKNVKKPVRLHLLGKGRLSNTPNWPDHIRPKLQAIDPDMDVSLDSVRIRAIVGRGGSDFQKATKREVAEEMEESFASEVPDWVSPALAQRMESIRQQAQQAAFEEVAQQRMAPKRAALTSQRDEIVEKMVQKSLQGYEEIDFNGTTMLIPSFAELWDLPSTWLSPSAQKRVLAALKKRFPVSATLNSCMIGKKYRYPPPTFLKKGGMDKENVNLFRKHPDEFIRQYSGDSYRMFRFGDLMAFLYGENFLPEHFGQDPEDVDYAFLDPDDGILTDEFRKYLTTNFTTLIKKVSLTQLPPSIKGLSLTNPRKRKMRRRNPLYESELSAGGIEICDDYDTDANCAFGSEDSELYHAATQYRSAWKRAKEAQRSRKGFPDRQPSGTPCPTTQILYDGLGRQYISEYKVFRTNDDGSGAIIPSNEPTSFWSIKTYPKALQARDLATTAEKLKITKMAQTLDPARLLTHHADATLGAPVVWEGKKGKYFVLAGNGRTIALLMAPKDKYAEYERLGKKKWGGIWPKGKDPKGKRSILVRVIRHADGKNLTERQAVQFAGGSQVSTSGAETPIREALSYMRALGVNKRELPYFEWYGEVNADNALKFARRNQAFTTEILSRLSPAQKARISSDPWVLAKTISMVLAGFVPLEIVDEGFSSVKEEEALLSFLPALVYLQKLIDDGQAKEKWNLLPHLIGAKFFLQAVRKLSYGKSITWIEEELPFLKKQTGMFGGGEDPLKNLTPLGIGLGMFLKRAVQASDPASKSVALKGYIQDALSASKTNMFGAPQSTITPVESIGEHLLGKQLGKKFVGAIMKTFGKQNPSSDGVNYGEIFDQLKGGMIVEVALKGYASGTGGLADGKYHRFKLGRKSTSKRYNTEKFRLLREDGRKTQHHISRYMNKPDVIQASSGDMAMKFIGLRLIGDKAQRKEDRIVVRDEDIGGFRSYSALQSYMEDQIVKSGYKISGEPRMSSVGSKQTGLIILFGKGSYLFGFLAEKGELSFQYSEKKKVKEDLKFPFSTLAEAKKIVKNLLGCIPQVVGEIKAQSAPPAPPQPSEKTLKMIKEIAKYAIAEFEIDLEADLTLPPSAQNSFGLMLSQTYKTPSKYRLPTTWDLSLYKLNKAEPLMLKIHSKGMDGIERKPLDIEVEIKSTSQGKSVIDDFISCVQDRVSTKEIPKKPVKSPPKKPAKKPVKKPTAKPKKKRSYSRKPKNHIVVWDGKKTTVKTDRASNVWATYVDEDDYSMITHLPSGLDVYESESLHEARQVMTDLGKKFKNWEIDLTVGQMPIQAKRKSMREFLEQYK